MGAPPASPAAPPSPPTPPTLAASPALTPPAAAASPAGPTPAFAATDLYAYKELRAQISALEARGVDDQAAQARQVAAAEQASLRAVQQQLEAATAAQTLAQKKVDGAQGCGLGRLCASKAKQQEKAAALTLALEAAQSQAAAAASKASTLQEQVAQADKAAAEAQIKVRPHPPFLAPPPDPLPGPAPSRRPRLTRPAALPPQVDELARLRRGQADLVERIFSAPSWASDPTLLTVQTAAADLGRQAAEVRGMRRSMHAALRQPRRAAIRSRPWACHPCRRPATRRPTGRRAHCSRTPGARSRRPRRYCSARACWGRWAWDATWGVAWAAAVGPP